MEMDSKVSVLTIVLLLSTVAESLRSCVDVQNTLMACFYSSNGSDVGYGDVDELCRHVGVLLECVEDARSTCPRLPFLTDPDFLGAVRSMEAQRDTYCSVSGSTTAASQQTTPDSMLGDEAESCDPQSAMMQCNNLMPNISLDDVKAMCQSGREFLDCMTRIVDNCPSYAEVLSFDFHLAINTTRNVLERECQNVAEEEDACAERIRQAKQGCADYLTDGDGDYCASLRTFRQCLDLTLQDCPDPELASVLFDQYQHHCIESSPQGDQHGGERSRCPDDVSAAMMECNNNMADVDPNDRAMFCRKSRKFMGCMEDLIERCENDSRFPSIPPRALEQMRQQIDSVCGDQPGPDREEHDGGASRCPDDMAEIVMGCSNIMADVDPSDKERVCRKSHEYLDCMEDILQRCGNDSRFEAITPGTLEQMRQQINSVCPHNAGDQPGPEGEEHGGGASKCSEDMAEVVAECNNIMAGVDPRDKERICRKSHEYLDCMEDILQRCGNDSRFEAINPGTLEQMRQQINSVCPHNGDQPSPQGDQHGGGNPECPDDVSEAVTECNIQDVDPSDIDTYCRKSREFLECIENLLQRCGNDSRLDALPPGGLEHMRQQVNSVCGSSGDQSSPQGDQHGNGRSRCPDDVSAAMKECGNNMVDVDRNDSAMLCRKSREFLVCMEDFLQRCGDVSWIDALPPGALEHMRQQVNSVCGVSGDQPSPQGDQHDGGRSRCPDDVSAAILECNNNMADVDPSDRVTFCRKSQKYLSCMEDLVQRCENHSRLVVALPPRILKQTREQINSHCAPGGEGARLRRAASGNLLRMLRLSRVP